MQPKYDLNEVFEIISSNDASKIWFSVPKKSFLSVVEAYRDSSKPKSNSEAVSFILNGILSLSNDDFVNQVSMYGDPKDIADEYGIIFDNKAWYIKLQIIDDELNEISFHPPGKKLTTFSGKVIYE